MNTCAHSIHSLTATRSLLSNWLSTLIWLLPDKILIYYKDAIAFANTNPFDYLVTRISSKVTMLLVYALLGAI